MICLTTEIVGEVLFNLVFKSVYVLMYNSFYIHQTPLIVNSDSTLAAAAVDEFAPGSHCSFRGFPSVHQTAVNS